MVERWSLWVQAVLGFIMLGLLVLLAFKGKDKGGGR